MRADCITKAARSKVFWNILDSDDCNVSSIKIFALPDMTTYDELKTFLEFIYSGSLPDTIPVEHFRTLYVAAKEYEIPYIPPGSKKSVETISSLSFHELIRCI